MGWTLIFGWADAVGRSSGQGGYWDAVILISLALGSASLLVALATYMDHWEEKLRKKDRRTETQDCGDKNSM